MIAEVKSLLNAACKAVDAAARQEQAELALPARNAPAAVRGLAVAEQADAHAAALRADVALMEAVDIYRNRAKPEPNQALIDQYGREDAARIAELLEIQSEALREEQRIIGESLRAPRKLTFEDVGCDCVERAKAAALREVDVPKYLDEDGKQKP
jgi:hypothetical protein